MMKFLPYSSLEGQFTVTVKGACYDTTVEIDIITTILSPYCANIKSKTLKFKYYTFFLDPPMGAAHQ